LVLLSIKANNNLKKTVNRTKQLSERLSTGYKINKAAESRIADTDMAAEMVQYAKESILKQINESILSQANVITKGVLNLLN